MSGYFTGYRQTLKRPDELIKTIRIPLPVAPVSAFHKIAKRRFDDISSVAVGFALRLDEAGTAARRRSRHQDRPRRRGGHPAAGHRHRGRPGRQALDPRRRRGGGRGADRRGHPDQTITGPAPRTAPRCSARRCASSSPRTPAPHRRPGLPGGLTDEQGTRAAGRPADQPQGRAGDLARERRVCTSPARLCTRTIWSTAPRTRCTPGRCRPRTRTPWSPRCGSTPRLPGARGGQGADRRRRARRERRRRASTTSRCSPPR